MLDRDRQEFLDFWLSRDPMAGHRDAVQAAGLIADDQPALGSAHRLTQDPCSSFGTV